MGKEQVAVFVDYENLRWGLFRHFQKRVPDDVTVKTLLEAIRQVATEIGTLYEGNVFGDWTLRGEDARAVENVQHFRAQLVLRSDSKKDRTDPAMNFAIDDFYRDKAEINHLLLCAGDSDYCEVVRRGTRLHRNMYICAVGAQTAPELLSLAKAFYPIEQRLGLRRIDAEEVKAAVEKLDPSELRRWAPLINQLAVAESRLRYVVRAYFINKYLPPALGFGETFEEKTLSLDFAEQYGLLESDKVPHPDSGMPVRVIRLKRDHDMVKTVLAKTC